MSTRLQWADLSPSRSVLYQVSDDNPFNKKVATVDYNHNDGTFISIVYDTDALKPFDVELEIPNKVKAMESAMAMLVARRFDKAD